MTQSAEESPPAQARRFGPLAKIIAVMCATLFGLALAEGALRVYEKISPRPALLDYKAARRPQGYGHGDGTGFGDAGYLRESFNGTLQDGYGRPIRWTNNAAGFRADEEFAVPKPPGTIRILSIGDSFAAGYRVDQNQTYSYLIQQAMRADPRFAKAGTRVEVLIAVLEEPTMQLEYLRDRGLRYDPDIVLVGVTLGNDIAGAYATQSEKGPYRFNRTADGLVLERKPEAADYAKWKKRQENIEIDEKYLDPGSLNDSGPMWSTKESQPSLRLLRVLRGALTNDNAPQTVISNGENYLHPRLFDANGVGIVMKDPPPEMAAAYDCELAALEGFRDLCSSKKVPLIVGIFPQRFQVQPEDWRMTVRTYNLRESKFDVNLPNQRILDFCREKGMECVDLTPGLHDAFMRDSKSLYLPRSDMHWNPRGHAAAAEVLLPVIKRYAEKRLQQKDR